MSTPIALGAFALLLAALGPALLRRSQWPSRAPRLGILAWQALTASVVLALFLAGATLALPAVPLSADLSELISGCTEALRAQYSTPGGAALGGTGALLAMGLVARCGYCLIADLLASRRQRRQHLSALTLVGRRQTNCDALVVDSHAVAAYCLPGRRREVVVTSAVLAILDDAELAAVLAHERAHLRGRHGLVLSVASALERAFPRVPVFRHARGEVTRLVEMAADDVAVGRGDRLTVATAVVRLAEASTPPATLAAGGSTAMTRVRRLVAPARPLGTMRSMIMTLAAASILAVPVAIVAAPATVAATAALCPLDGPQPSPASL